MTESILTTWPPILRTAVVLGWSNLKLTGSSSVFAIFKPNLTFSGGLDGQIEHVLDSSSTLLQLYSLNRTTLHVYTVLNSICTTKQKNLHVYTIMYFRCTYTKEQRYVCSVYTLFYSRFTTSTEQMWTK